MPRVIGRETWAGSGWEQQEDDSPGNGSGILRDATLSLATFSRRWKPRGIVRRRSRNNLGELNFVSTCGVPARLTN